MKLQNPFENEFQELKAATIQEFEEELEGWKKLQKRLKPKRLERVKRFHGCLEAAMAESGIETKVVERLRQYHDQESKELQQQLAELRAGIRDDDPDLMNRAHRQLHFNLARLQHVEKRKQAFCIDAHVVAGPDMLQELKKSGGYLNPPPGVKQNPYANSTKPDTLKLKASHSGSGSGMGAYGKPFPVWGFFYFYYVPPADTGVVTATLDMFYYGFWLVKADDGCWDNKDASASLDVWMRWQQGPYVSPWTKHPFMWAAGDNIYFYKVHIGEIDSYSRQIGPLLGGHPVWITVAVGLEVDARGGGSHAEINYADGPGRSVWAMSMFIG